MDEKQFSKRGSKIIPMLDELEIMASKLNLPEDVKAEAATICTNYYKENPSDYARYPLISLTATIYAACRRKKLPITLDKIILSTTARGYVDRIYAERMYWRINKTLKLKIVPLKAEDYISTFCTGLKLSDAVRNKAKELVREVENSGLATGRKPTAVAATVIYIAAGALNEYRSEYVVADVAGVTSIPIRYLKREMIEKHIINTKSEEK